MRTQLTDEFLMDVAARWYEAAMQGQKIERTLAAHYQRPPGTINRWIGLARQRSFLEKSS